MWADKWSTEYERASTACSGVLLISVPFFLISISHLAHIPGDEGFALSIVGRAPGVTEAKRKDLLSDICDPNEGVVRGDVVCAPGVVLQGPVHVHSQDLAQGHAPVLRSQERVCCAILCPLPVGYAPITWSQHSEKDARQ